MSVYETYLKEKSKIKPSKGSVYSDYLDKQRLANVPTEKAQRIEQGLPTSLFKNRAEPNLAEKIAQGVIRPVADVLTNVENTARVVLGKEKLKVAKSKWLGDIKGLGEIDITKSPFDKENLKVILNSASTGAEIASYLTTGGIAKSTVTELTKRGVLTSKQTFAEWVVKQFPKLAKEGFIQGTAYTAGSQGREYVASGTKPSLGQAVTDIALSTIGSVAIPAILQKTFGTATKKILNARETERAIANARILGRPIPEAGVPSAKFMTETGRTLPAPRTPGEIPIELPAPGILKSAEDLRKPTSLSIKQETYSVPTKTPKGESVYEQFAKEKAGTSPAPSTPTQTIPKVENQLLKDVGKMADELEGFDPSTFIEFSTQIRKLDPDEIMNVAMGGNKTIDNTIPANAYLSIAKNIAEETGDVRMIKELASSDVASKTGQGLVSSRMTNTGNIVDDLRQVVLQKLRNKKLDPTKLTQEQNILFKKAKDRIVEFAKTTKQGADNIINSLICK